MAGKCCHCMVVGKCKNCMCVKAGTWCVNCYPSRNGHCLNQNPSLTPLPSSSSSLSTSSTTHKLTQSSATIISQTVQLLVPTTSSSWSVPLSPVNLNTQGDLGLPDTDCLLEDRRHLENLCSTLPEYNPLMDPVADSILHMRDAIELAYSKIVHWRPNIFKLPSGNASKQFIDELTNLFNSYNEGSVTVSFTITSAMVFPALILLKPSRESKAKDHLRCLECRLALWRDGDLSNLLNEGEFIQKHLPPFRRFKDTSEHVNKRFFCLMHQGDVKNTIHLLSKSNSRGVLDLESVPRGGVKSVLEILQEKHPTPHNIYVTNVTVDRDHSAQFHPVIFDSITPDRVKLSAMRTAGPLGIDASSWRIFCTSFGRSSTNLCRSLANYCKIICSDYVDPKGLSAYVACKLIPLDKNPGVRPIGIVEVIRRNLGKVTMSIVKSDPIEAISPLQLCAGLEGGCEAAIHFSVL